MSAVTVPGVRLPRALADAIVDHARAERPNEACGLLVGPAPASDGGVPSRYVPCRNAAASPSRYLVHRDDLLAVLDALDRSGEELWGVVHSHVRTAAVPSPVDVREAVWPTAVYLLVSLAGEPEAASGEGAPALRAWRVADGVASELPLVVADDVAEGAA